MTENLNTKVVIEERFLYGSNDPDLLQRVATVYINNKEYRVYSPPEARGDALEWLPHLTVRQLADANSEVEIRDAFSALALRALKEELAPKKQAGLPPGLLGPKEFAGMSDEQLHEVKMGSEPHSNYWEWATAEQEERARRIRGSLPRTTVSNAEKESVRWDFFICHASEDKDAIAKPLADSLRGSGLAVWYDEFSLSLGDSLRESIDQGLAKSRFGIVILSPHFFEKHWTKQELNGLAAREVSGAKVILPVWHRIGPKEVRELSPMLADRVAVSTDQGLADVVEKILDAATRKKGV